MAGAQQDPRAEFKALYNRVEELFRQRQYEEATPLALRELATAERAFGPNDPYVAASLYQLALVYGAQQRFAESEPLLKRALAIEERELGPIHKTVAGILEALANLYRAQSRTIEAEEFYRRTLSVKKEVFGPYDSEYAHTLSSLANLYQESSRYAEAEELDKQALEIWERTLGPNAPEVAGILNNWANLDNDRGRYADAEERLQRAISIWERTSGQGHKYLAVSLQGLANANFFQGHYAEAESLYKRALTIAGDTQNAAPIGFAQILNNLAGLYRAQGRYSEGEPLLRRTLLILEEEVGPDHPLVAAALNNFATFNDEQGRYLEAEQMFKRALAIKEKTLDPSHPDIATTLDNLAALYEHLARFDEALPLIQRALTIREEALSAEHPDVAISYRNLAVVKQDQGLYDAAEPLYKRALAIREHGLSPGHPDIGQSLSDLAWNYHLNGLHQEALRESRRAVTIQSNRALQSTPEFWSDGVSEQRGASYLYLRHLEIIFSLAAQDGGQAQALKTEAFETAQYATGSAVGRALSQAVVRFATGTDVLASVVRERQDDVSQWQALNRALLAGLSSPPTQRSALGESEIRQAIQDLDARIKGLDQRIAVDFPAYAELTSPKPVTLPDAQAFLGENEVMLVYTVAEDATFLWTLRRDRWTAVRIGIGAKALTEEVLALRQHLDPEQNRERRAFDVERSYSLYQKILAPAAPLLDGATRVIVVPDGALQSLPLGVLVTNSVGDTADYRKVPWFARDHAITMLPTISSLRALRQFAKPTSAPQPFIGIGNPLLSNPPDCRQGVALASVFRGATGDIDAIRQLCSLPETGEELKALARAQGASPDNDVYLADRATKPNLQSLPLVNYRVIAFATHGLVAGEIKALAEPALVLTPPATPTTDDDGLLTASEVTQLKLNADWVILSACSTAAGDVPGGEALSGLAKAFFYAGARSLLVSHWPVESSAAEELTVRTLGALRKDPTIGRAEALRRAEMDLLDSADPRMAHPMAWAPFSLIGEGSAR